MTGQSIDSALGTPVAPAYLGRQLMADFNGCDVALLADHAAIEQAMRAAAVASGATIVECVFHHFNPHGVSGVVVIAESHLAIHTWPEHAYAAVDVFTCGEGVDPTQAVATLALALGATHHAVTEVGRGPLALMARP